MKALLVALVALFALLVGLNNITDYDSNFAFVQHVLEMDTTFEGNRLMWRRIEAPWVHHLGYVGIIALEVLTGVLCAAGAWQMFTARSAAQGQFNRAVLLASWGLATGVLLWFGGFITVGAEWFLMWQSPSWNGQQAAFRFVVCLLACLIFINLPEPATGDADR
ncbi:MAG: DUF2165 domain-containing protein [Halieaceae bacterium]|jgi:predicted small integral membrane protein|nr:DUF2165 domain-containing protein [Halieaceae bacterium]